jgi:hypothetical protein
MPATLELKAIGEIDIEKEVRGRGGRKEGGERERDRSGKIEVPPLCLGGRGEREKESVKE